MNVPTTIHVDRTRIAARLAWLAASLVLLAAGCGGHANDKEPAASDPSRPFAGQTLRVFNWSDYIDPDLLKEFEAQTGAKVQYDNFASDAELETKMLAGGSEYDVIFPSDRSMTPLVKKGLLAPLDKSLLPGMKHLDPKFLDARFDRGNRYSVPYFWGTVAVGVQSDKVDKDAKDFKVLFDPKYSGHITMLDDPENVVAIVLLSLNLPMNSTKDEDLAKVKAVLKAQRPLVQAYTSDAFKDKLISGDAWVALGWSGDILQAREKRASVRVIVPSSGSMIWADSMAIPVGAKQPKLAHAFIDFLLGPEVAARNANFVRYPTPNAAARAKVDPALRSDPAVYPPADVLDRCQWLEDRGADISKIERLWREIK